MRPCTCENYQPNSGYDNTQCRFCWLYHHDAHYHKIWGGQEPPSFFEKFVNLAGAVSRAAVQAVKRQPLLVSEEIKKERLKICHSCENYLDGGCTKCGCYLELKAKTATEKCPVGKWLALPASES